MFQEKSLGYIPIQMMDREKASIPQLQYGFLDNIAYPIYEYGFLSFFVIFKY